MSYKIKRTSDINIIKELNNKCFGKKEPFETAEKSIHWIVLDSKSNMAGFASGRPVKDEPELFFLNRCGVLKSYTGNGLQVRLIRTRVQYAKKAGFKSVITYTAKDNGPSIWNLQKAGFKLYIPKFKYVGDEYLYWIKKIS